MMGTFVQRNGQQAKEIEHGEKTERNKDGH